MTRTSTTPAPSTNVGSSAVSTNVDSGEMIPVLRAQIDALDEAIIRLVAERTRVSRRIQTARINGGGTRVELGRERVVLATYRDGLGADGPHLADAVLQVCRGSR